MEEFEERKGEGAWCNNTIISKYKSHKYKAGAMMHSCISSTPEEDKQIPGARWLTSLAY